jgi:light-regulated signal transduction histidine kinase (bacteriophytochrome)
MIHQVNSLAGGDSQSLHEMGPSPDPVSERLKPESGENILNLSKIMSHDIRSSLLSMLATLKLLNRGYYGKMDEEVGHKIKDLLSSATRLTEIAEACLRGTYAGNEEVEIAGPNRVMEPRERNTPDKQLSTEAKGKPLIP